MDTKKLEKAEAKSKQKLEKRENKDFGTQSNVSTYDSAKNASASQSLSKKMEIKNESDSNRSFDIIIENFDVAFGNK